MYFLDTIRKMLVDHSTFEEYNLLMFSWLFPLYLCSFTLNLFYNNEIWYQRYLTLTSNTMQTKCVVRSSKSQLRKESTANDILGYGGDDVQSTKNDAQ